MTTDLYIASAQQGGAPMIGVLLAIAVVTGIVYLVKRRSGEE